MRRPFRRPMSSMASARAAASAGVFINAPLPYLTSKTILCAPAASFLLIMLEAISGRLSTVQVTSRRAYNFLSAGANSPLCPTTAMPICCTWAKNRSSDRVTRKDGMDSSLSMVPPVSPRPLPDILAILQPAAAAIGATISVVLSPTPPVECLSADKSPKADKSSASPDFAISSVK